MNEPFIDNRPETMIEQVKRLENMVIALQEENVILREQNENMCENCDYPGIADRARDQLIKAQREYNHALYVHRQQIDEMNFDLDRCRDQAHKCKIENKRLKSGY